MSRETIEVVKGKLQKNLNGAKDTVENEVWGCARIYIEIVGDLLDLVNSIQTDGDPTDDDDVSNVVHLVKGEVQ